MIFKLFVNMILKHQNRHTLWGFILILPFLFSCNSENPVSEKDSELMDLINQMTVQEKVGQMTQLNIDVLSVGEVYNLKEPHELDPQKLKKALVEYGVGSVLNVGGHAYDLEHWREITVQIQKVATEDSRLKIPVLYGIDAIHGANYLLGGTLFPQPLAQAATFNPELVRQGAQITAYETRASGIPWNFSPVLDVARQPLWSRVFETYGEDVYVTRTMGVAAVEGYQGEDPSSPHAISACMKHFLGYSIPFTGKDRTTCYIPERQLREYFLPSFKDAIEAGALSVMINSGDINGIPVHADKAILTDLLRRELGFDGVAVTDWEDIMKLEYPHKVAKDLKEAVKIAINAGIDMSMVPNDYRFSDLLVELVNEGEVSMDRIDEAVYRILLMKKRLGLFENPTTFSSDYSLVSSDSFSRVSNAVAEESITLLKNTGILPLNPSLKVLVTGPTANSLTAVNGAWSRTWQGVDAIWDDTTKHTILDELKLQSDNITFVQGCDFDSLHNLGAIKNLAKPADVIVACFGEQPSTEKPGDIHSLDISETQIEYFKYLKSFNVPIVLALIENRPRVVRELEPYCDAIVLAYQPSENGTKAFADILYGKVNPSGKLPLTYPRYTNTLVPYDHNHTDKLHTDFSYNAFNPQWEFGHGLSYTNFTYSNLSVDTTQLAAGKIGISIDVSNTGDYKGKETVLVYVTDEVASIAPPVKRLRAFDKRLIEVGKTETYQFEIDLDDLAFVGLDNTWQTESGTYTIHIGNERVSFNLN